MWAARSRINFNECEKVSINGNGESINDNFME